MFNLVAGVARANITPPVGMLMAGYGNRKTPAVGVHDELHVVALYLSDGRTEAGLITADLIDTDATGTARVRAAAQAISGVPAANIMVAMSHTHGGPQTPLWMKPDPDPLMEAYAEVVVAKMAGALAEAKRNAAPVRVGYGRQDCDIAVNRRERTEAGVILGVNPDGPRQPFVDVIRFDDTDSGEPKAVVMAYAAHGTTLGGDNLLYTADYIGEAKRALERQIPSAVALFVAGCSGDINPHPRGMFAHATSHGLRLGSAAAQAAYEVGEMAQHVRVGAAQQPFSLSVEAPPSLNDVRERLAQLDAAVAEEMEQAARAAGAGQADPRQAVDYWLERERRNLAKLVAALEGGETEFAIPMEAQALAIGGIAIVGLPGEVFVEIGAAAVAASPFAHTVAISHANGSAGYLPTASEVPAGGYEIDRARAHLYGLTIVPESDRVAIEAAAAALKTCSQEVSR